MVFWRFSFLYIFVVCFFFLRVFFGWGVFVFLLVVFGVGVVIFDWILWFGVVGDEVMYIMVV